MPFGIQPAMHRVRDHIPLEQGLRLIPVYMEAVKGSGQRPYSIRTRIKTTDV